jgi:hypothetical protein
MLHTLRNSIPVVMPTAKSTLATMFGSAKGNLTKNQLFPNNAGKFSAGLAKNPPNEGPKIEPRLQTRGMIEKARGCSSFSGTISATIVRIIPTGRHALRERRYQEFEAGGGDTSTCKQWIMDNQK